MVTCRVFSISHSCVVPAYRLRQAAVARHDGVEVTLLTPKVWRQFNMPCEAPPKDPEHDYALTLRQPIAWGLPHHGLRNATHIYPGLRSLIEEAQPDILELWEEPFFAVAWQAIRAFRRIRPHGPVLFFSAQNIHRRYLPPFSWFERFVYRQAAGCFAMSEEVASVLAARGWNGPSTVLPLGVDPQRYASSPAADAFRAAHGLTGTVVCFLGRLSEEKGVLDLAEAAGRVSDVPDWSLLYVGEGDCTAAIRARLAHFPHPLAFAGGVPHDDVPTVLSAADVVVVPSRTTPAWKEQFGRVAVEAMAAGAAVIVSDSGELPTVVGSAGRIVPEGNPDALAEALRALLTDSAARHALADAGREKVRQAYAWDVIAAKQVEVYRAVS